MFLPNVLVIQDDSDVCVSCGSKLKGHYCHQCGEKRTAREDYTIKRFILNIFSTITNIDSKFYKSFRLILLKPGFLVQEYFVGRRRLYLTPIQMFLIANLFYFVIQPYSFYPGYYTPLSSQLGEQIYSGVLHLDVVIQERIAARGMAYEDYEDLFNAKTSTYARSLIFLLIPLLALELKLLYWNAKEFFLEHFVWAMHYYTWEITFIYTIFLFLYQFILTGVHSLFNFTPDIMVSDTGPLYILEMLLGTLFYKVPALPFVIAFTFLGLRRYYQTSKFALILNVIAVNALVLGNAVLYRLILFWITYQTI